MIEKEPFVGARSMSTTFKTRVLSAVFHVCIAMLWYDRANAVEEEYRPDWAAVKPVRSLTLLASPNESATQNGERLRKRIEQLAPGDLLEIGTGTYSVERLWDLAISGTKDAPIWIVASNDSKVVLTRPDAKQNVLNVGQSNPVQYLAIQGLEITGGSHGIRLGKCQDVWIDRCHIHHTGDVCLSANSADTSRLYLTRNTIHDGKGTAEGMYLGGNKGEVIMSQSVIALNHVYECHGSQGDGIEVKQGSWGNRIVANEVHDCNYPCITVYGTNGMPQNIIERNVCYRSLDSVMQVQGEAIVRNNLLIDGKNGAFSSTDHQGKTTNLQVIHNTMINTNHAFRGGSWNDRKNMILANNVLYSKMQNAIHFANGSQGVEVVGNVLLGDGPKFGSAIGRGLQDFVNLSWDGMNRDATPSPDAALRKGNAKYGLPVDLNGKARITREFALCGAIDSK